MLQWAITQQQEQPKEYEYIAWYPDWVEEPEIYDEEQKLINMLHHAYLGARTMSQYEEELDQQ